MLRPMQAWKRRSSNAPADASLETAEQQCSGRCKPGNGGAALFRQMQAWKRRSSIAPADVSLEAREQHCSGGCKPGSAGAALLPQMQGWERRSNIAPANARLETPEQHCSRRCKLGNAAAILLVFFKENLDRFKKNLENDATHSGRPALKHPAETLGNSFYYRMFRSTSGLEVGFAETNPGMEAAVHYMAPSLGEKDRRPS